ncbi:hypothetical protein JTE90_002199 [Oedothorax gibbosus]|uniref:USP domain-containing protein n=1 Tax=Oedothorax gibbosus TaxID=931172 RepID=A0AAV6VGF9_9ARAC|nr:hypothetical protein JTE90_002199 [Oedothorax gibbosus]
MSVNAMDTEQGLKKNIKVEGIPDNVLQLKNKAYQLEATVFNHSNSSQSGHYTAIRRHADHQWIKINDTKVSVKNKWPKEIIISFGIGESRIRYTMPEKDPPFTYGHVIVKSEAGFSAGPVPGPAEKVQKASGTIEESTGHLKLWQHSRSASKHLLKQHSCVIQHHTSALLDKPVN